MEQTFSGKFWRRWAEAIQNLKFKIKNAFGQTMLSVHAKTYIFVLVVGVLLSAVGSEEKLKLSSVAKQSAISRREKIDMEIQGLDGQHPWAGKYFHGDGFVSASMDVAPTAGFVYEQRGCLGTYDRNYGQIVETTNGLELKCELANDEKESQGIETNLVSIAWGERHYLVPDNEMTDFCNAVNSKREPRQRLHGFFLLRRGDEEKKVNGAPTLPPQFQKLLRSNPITAHITSVGRTHVEKGKAGIKFRETTMALNVGSLAGVFEGMEFHLIEPNSIESVKVTRVEENSCEALMQQIGEKNRLKPKTGWKLSTIPSDVDYVKVTE